MNDTRDTVLIVGLAREGVSLARFFARRGARVTVTDAAPAERLAERMAAVDDPSVRFVLGDHRPDCVRDAERVFISPGVPESNPVYRAAVNEGLKIESMTTLFFDLCAGPIIGITGSSGKTTTTGLIGHILRSSGMDVVVGGNIGDPMLDLLPSIGHGTQVVLELSSFQLSLLRRSPHIAVVTNVTPNHLDRHGTMDEYVASKMHITAHQHREDIAVLNHNDAYAQRFAESTPGDVRWFGSEGRAVPTATARDGWIGMLDSAGFEPIMHRDEIPLPGDHNVENVLAAACVASTLHVDPRSVRDAIRTFQTAPHRLQTVGERGGVRFVDDSIATSPARAMVALRAIRGPIILIAGGRDKNLPLREFADAVVARTRALFLIGEAADLIAENVRAALDRSAGTLTPQHIYRCATLEQAVGEASALAVPGDTVLLAPACASYDMFRDFEERGATFAHAVEAHSAA